ncbi:MAG: DUF6516 family protein [Chloroflexota bacterium]
MPDPAEYLSAVELAFVESPVITNFSVVRQWANSDDGYIRVRATLLNNNFLEAAEYFVQEDEEIATVDYRYHWAAPDKQQLRRRWDNTPDHPELPNFPHHCHIESETNVVSSEAMNMLQLLKVLQNLIAPEKK